jgi:hypothetical protein
MSRAQLVLHRGEKFESQGLGRFAKDILHPGAWIHPQTGQRVFFDDARIKRLVESTNRYIRAGNVVRYPDGHSFKATDNLGDWPGPFIVHKGRLVGVVEAKNPKAAEGMAAGTIDAVSAFIEFDHVDTKGNTYDEVITHVCATPYPVITGQKGFIPLSAVEGDSGNIEAQLLVPEDLALAGKGDDMDRKQVLAMLETMGLSLSKLGLAEDAPVEKIATALSARVSAAPAAAEALAGLRKQVGEALSAHGLALEADGKVVVLPKPEKKDDDPEKKELRERLAVVERDGKVQKLTLARDEAEKYVQSKVIPPALREDLALILSCSLLSDRKALSLSGDGTQLVEKAIDLHRAVTNVLGHVTATLGQAQRLSQFVPASDAEKAKGEAGVKRAQALAREVQGRKE